MPTASFRPSVLLSQHPATVSRIAAVILLVVVAPHAAGQNRDPEAVFERAEERREEGVDTHCCPGCIDRFLAPCKDCRDDLATGGGPRFEALYAPAWQVGTQGGPHNQLASQSFNLYGEWELLQEKGNEGTLYMFYLHESDSLGSTAGEFAQTVGTVILPNDDVGDATNALAHFGWTQKFCDGDVEIAFGQLALKIMLDQNDYAGWDRTSFMAGPLSGNPVRNFPIAALGIDTTVHVTDELQVSCVVADADGYPFYPDFQSFGRRFVYVPGFVYSPVIPCLGQGRYEVNFSHIERTERFGGTGPSSSVWLFSFNQDLSEDLAVFLRYGAGDGRRTDVRTSFAAGVVFTQMCGFNNDHLGIGFIHDNPTNSARADDYGMEVFWRLQLTDSIQLTPDVQLYFDPSRNPTSDIEAAFGIRLGVYL